MYEVHFFFLLGFSKKYYDAFKIISTNKKRNRGNWLINNLVFPIIVIFSPLLLTLVSFHFKTINFNKSITQVIISGAITLLGINVIRTASTNISEKLSYEKIPVDFIPNIVEIENEIGALKKRLVGWSWILSVVGFILYFMQIGLLINDSNNNIYWYVLGILIVFCLSIFLGRFISLMESNLFEREEFTKLLFSKLITQNQDYSELEKLLNNQGL